MERHAPSTCPQCGRGRLVDMSFDERSRDADARLRQTADSHEILTYTCGHSVVGASLATADPRQLDVERRTSDETVDPAPAGGEAA